MKSFEITIEHTVVTRQTVTVEAATKRDALFAAPKALKPTDWEETGEFDKIVSAEAVE